MTVTLKEDFAVTVADGGLMKATLKDREREGLHGRGGDTPFDALIVKV